MFVFTGLSQLQDYLQKLQDQEANLEPLIEEKPALFKSQVNQVSFSSVSFPLCGRPLVFVPRDEWIGEKKVRISTHARKQAAISYRFMASKSTRHVIFDLLFNMFGVIYLCIFFSGDFPKRKLAETSLDLVSSTITASWLSPPHKLPLGITLKITTIKKSLPMTQGGLCAGEKLHFLSGKIFGCFG